MSGINWNLAAQPVNPLQALQVFGAAQQQRQQEMERERLVSIRGTKSDYVKALLLAGQGAQPTSGSGAVHSPPANPVADHNGAAPPSSTPQPSSGIANLVEAGTAATQPPSAANAALSRLADLDPDAVFGLQEQERKARKDQLDMLHQLNIAGIQYLARSTDQASWDRNRRRFSTLLTQNGGTADDYDIPEVFSPEARDGLILSALDFDDRLSAERGAKRLQWDIEDDEADNTRADRDIDDRIADRSARRGLTERGQNIASTDRRRGQDVSATTTRRGQDLTDKRLRDNPPQSRTTRPPAPRAEGTPPRVATKADYDRLPRGAVYQAPDGSTKRKN